jgi:hypothetical protein
MASIINADTSNGLKLTSDTTGQLDFQSAGSTKATIDTAGNLKFDSGYGSVATVYGCRAWVNFNGSGTVAIRGSGNVSSITDNSTGNYTVNFATDMPDTNYSTVQGYSPASSNCYVTRVSTLTVSSVRMGTYLNYANGAALDMSMVAVTVFR